MTPKDDFDFIDPADVRELQAVADLALSQGIPESSIPAWVKVRYPDLLKRVALKVLEGQLHDILEQMVDDGEAVRLDNGNYRLLRPIPTN